MLVLRVDGRNGGRSTWQFVYGGLDDVIGDDAKLKRFGLKAQTDEGAIEEAERLYVRSTENIKLTRLTLRLGPRGATYLVAAWEFQGAEAQTEGASVQQ